MSGQPNTTRGGSREHHPPDPPASDPTSVGLREPSMVRPPAAPESSSRGSVGAWKPWKVIDVDLARPIARIRAQDRGQSWGGAWILIRVFDEPVGSMALHVDKVDISPSAIVDAIPPDVVSVIRERLDEARVGSSSTESLPVEGVATSDTAPYLVRRRTVAETGPPVTAVVCTRDQPDGLERCLASLQAQSYPRTNILVVDNASSTDAARHVVASSSGPFHPRYVFESRPGLSNARNRALREVTTELVAWIDDDEVADPHWLSQIVGAFIENPEADAVCGVIVPAELETQPQYWFEEYGGHSKGRGFERVLFSPATRHLHNPLFPLPPFGTGANMAVRRSAIEAINGFDPALGAGTPTFGAEDTRALTEILLAGGSVLYDPTAITRHFHRRDYEAFRRQLYGYGVALSAFYASLICGNPLLLRPLISLLPRALRELRDPNGPRLRGITPSFPEEVLRWHRSGMIRGPVEYLRSRLRAGWASRGLGGNNSRGGA